MNAFRGRRGLCFWALSLLLLVIPPGAAAVEKLIFSSGPDGGTFQYFSNGIASRLEQQYPDWEISRKFSAGSVENIRRTHKGEADFGIAYSGDVYLASKGRLDNDPTVYDHTLAVAYLYGAPAHLAVLKDSPIHAVEDLAGKRVAIGGAGSGAATSAQRYFESLGLWSELKIDHIGYTEAAWALADGTIDAMWILAGHPNTSILQAAAKMPIRLLDTWAAGERAGFFKTFPFYSPVTIPAGTYQGVEPVRTFQDSAIWVAGQRVDEELVHQALMQIFSPEGLAYMVKVKSTAKDMSVKSGLTGIVTQVHPGAKRFWLEQGLGFIPGD